MVNHLSGAEATVLGTSYTNPSGLASKEKYTWGILAALEGEEGKLQKIVERTDKITINVDLSKKVATIDLLLNVIGSTTPEGNVTFSTPHYLVGSTFTSGSGGDSNAQNLAQAAMEAVVSLKAIELNPARNPQGKTVITRCTYTLGASGGTNATFSATLEFPIETISLPGGGNVIEGAEWLV